MSTRAWTKCPLCDQRIYWVYCLPPTNSERRWVAFDDELQQLASCYFDSCGLHPPPDLFPPEFVCNARAHDWGVGRILERHASSTVAFFVPVGRRIVRNEVLQPVAVDSVSEDSLLRLPASVLNRLRVYPIRFSSARAGSSWASGANLRPSGATRPT